MHVEASRTRKFGSFDYVIVGAGTAGCVLANRLSQDPDFSVLLIEAGGVDNWIWIHVPVGYLFCIGNPRTDWCYRTEADVGLGGRSILYARGRVLGGSSSINAMIYMRGQATDYDRWSELVSDASWSWDSMLPLFKRSENHWHGPDEYHGGSGEMRVETQRLRWDILDRFAAAAAQAGIPPTDDFNRGDNGGSGQFEVTQRRGVRWSASRAFLKPVMGRSNLTVITDAVVDRVLIEGRRARGVRFTREGQPFHVNSRIETVLAAGSIGSPSILQRSGVGNPVLMGALGIPLVHALPGVGENLQDHLQLRTVYRVQGIRSLNTMAHSLWRKALMAAEYAARRTGPLSMAPSQLGVFAKSDPAQASANLQYHVQPLSLDKFGDPLHRFPAFTASVCNLRPTSRGFVRIASTSETAAPRIAPNYLSTEEDRGVSVNALRLTRHIVSMPALSPYITEEYLPGAHVRSDEELIAAAGQIGTTIFHPVGTCQMGQSADSEAVVDSRLRVHGIQGLRIADASIMPMIVSGNTNAPTVVIAEKASDMMREDRRH